MPELRELLNERGLAHSCLWQLAQDRLELCLVYCKGEEQKILALCYCLCNRPAPFLAGDVASGCCTESATALFMLRSLLGCSSASRAHLGSKIADKIMYVQLSEGACKAAMQDMLAAEHCTGQPRVSLPT